MDESNLSSVSTDKLLGSNRPISKAHAQFLINPLPSNSFMEGNRSLFSCEREYTKPFPVYTFGSLLSVLKARAQLCLWFNPGQSGVFCGILCSPIHGRELIPSAYLNPELCGHTPFLPAGSPIQDVVLDYNSYPLPLQLALQQFSHLLLGLLATREMLGLPTLNPKAWLV